MKTISAYMAADGSLHKTREEAAVQDVVAMGFVPVVAAEIVERLEALTDLHLQVSGRAYITTYRHPEPSLTE